MNNPDLFSVARELGDNAPTAPPPAAPYRRSLVRPSFNHPALRRPRLGRTAWLAFAVVVLLAVSVLLGSYTVTVPDFVRIVTAQLTGGKRIPGASFIVLETKLPRAVLGTMIGLAFGLSGALFQRMLRNPLASPDIIGISQGASALTVGELKPGVISSACGSLARGTLYSKSE